MKEKNNLSFFENIFLFLLIFIPLSFLAYFFRWSALSLMLISALGIIPLSKYIGEATDALASRLGTAWGGILNVTFGNATELIIGILALRKGLTDLAKASITGSILGNILLVLGTAILVAGFKYKKMEFNRTAALVSASTLLLAVISLVMPDIFYLTAPSVGANIIEKLSLAVAILILLVYIGYLFFMFSTHKHLYVQEEAKVEKLRWSKLKSIAILLVSTVFVSILSEFLVESVEPVVRRFGWTELFIGVIFVAIIGNAAEHTSAILVALKNRMDLTLQIALGSATQISMLVAPILVLSSWFFPEHMNLIFRPFELVSIALAVFTSNLIIEDGETHWFEGLQLVITYCIMAVAFFLHP